MKLGSLTTDIEFQFLYGTIKRAIQSLKKNKIEKFQFLYGTIKRTPQPTTPSASEKFQFLYGTIKSTLVLGPIPSIMISIPIWYD